MANSYIPESIVDVATYTPELTPEQQAVAAQEQAAFNARQGLRNALNAANSGSTTDKVLDSTKNIVGGVGTGVLDSASFLAGLVGARDTSKAIANVSHGVEEVFRDMGSTSEKGKAELYEYAQAESKAKANAQYQQDLANGMSEGEAALKRESTLFADTLKNQWESGNLLKEATTGIGSVGSDIALTGGGSALLKMGAKAAKAGYSMAKPVIEASAAKKYLPGIERAANAVAQGKFVKEGSLLSDIGKSRAAQYLGGKLKNNAGWMTSVGLQEGGNNFRQQLLDTLENTDWDNSPEYHSRVAEKVEEYKAKYGIDPDETALQEIHEAVKEDLAFESARESGIKTGLTAAALANLTKWEMKPFERSGRTASRLIGEALTEPLEEGLTEGAGQYFQNQAIRDYVNNTQDPYEDIGSSSATGAASGLGMTAIRGTPSVLGETAKGVGFVANAGLSHIPVRTSAEESDSESKPETSSVNESTTEIPTSTPKETKKTFESVRENLDQDSSDVSSVFDNLDQTVANAKKTTKQDESGNEVQKTSEDYIAELNAIQKDLETLNTSEVTEKTAKSDSEAQIKKNDKFESAKSNAELHLKDAEQSVKDNLKTLATKLYTEARANPDKALNNQEATDIGNFLSILPEDPRDAMLKGLSDKQISTIKNAMYKSDKAKKAIEASIDTLEDLRAEESTDVKTDFDLTDRAADSAKVYTQVSTKENTLRIAEKRRGVLPVEFQKNEADLTNFKAEVDAKDSVGLAKKVFGENADYAFIDFDESAPKPENTYTVRNTAKNKTTGIEYKNKHILFNNGAFAVKEELAKVLDNPEASFEEKTKAMQQAVSEIFKDPVKVTPAAIRYAKNLMRGSASKRALGKKIFRRLGKVADFAMDGDIVIHDVDLKEHHKAVQNALRGLGEYVVPIKRSLHLMTQTSPLDSLRDLVRSPKNLQEFLKMNHITNAESLYRKLTQDGKGNELPITESKTTAKGSNLASQVLAILNPQGEYMTQIMPAIEKMFAKSEGLKDIIYDSDGKLDPKFKEYFAIVGAHYLATMSAYPHDLREDECMRWGIDYYANSSFIERSGSLGMLAPAGLANLATNLKNMLGVVVSDQAPAHKVDAIFAEMASRLTDAFLDANILESTKESVKDMQGESKDVYFLKIKNEDLEKTFQSKADILDALLNPVYKNRVNYKVQEASDHIENTTEALSYKAHLAVAAANSKAAHLNLLFVKLLGALGGKSLFGKSADWHEDRKYFTTKAWQKVKGQNLTRQLAYDYLQEAIQGRDPKISLEDLELYFDNMVIKNGRIMQKGAATYQSNKALRQALMYSDMIPVDLNNADSLKAWKVTLAQKLGQSVNKTKFESYSKHVDEVLSQFEHLPKDVQKVFDKLDSLNAADVFNSENQLDDSDVVTLKNFIKKFNKVEQENHGKDAYAIKDDESLNALLEMVRFHTEDKSKFVPHIFLEIDGISDGPAYINRLFGIAVSALTPSFLSTMAKTGFIPLVNTTANNVLTEGSDASKLFGTDGNNLHDQVAKEELPKLLKERVKLLNKNLISNNGSKVREAKRVRAALQAFLTLMQIAGLVNGDVRSFISGKGDITFNKDISKKLTTIILYGSGIRGATQQIVDMLLQGEYGKDGLYGVISDDLLDSDTLEAIEVEDGVDDEGNPQYVVDFREDKAKQQKAARRYAQIRTALNSLFSVSISTSHESGNTYYQFSETGDISKFSKGSSEFPSVSDFSRPFTKGKGEVIFDTDSHSEANIVQNFEVTEAGRKHLVDLLAPIFGEVAYEAVATSIGKEALQASKLPIAAGAILTSLARVLEGYHLKNTPIENRTIGDERHQRSQITEDFAPNIQLDSGAKIIAERRSVTADTKPTYKGRTPATDVYTTNLRLSSSGVAWAALMTQGSGDTTTAYRTLKKHHGNFGQVFDGFYTSVDDHEQMSQDANLGAKEASQLRPISLIQDRLIAAAKNLQGIPRVSTGSIMGTLERVLIRASQGKYPDGSKMSEEDSKLMKDIQDDLSKALVQFNQPFVYKPSIFDARQIFFKNHKKTEVGISKKLEDLIPQFFAILDNAKNNEAVNHTALEMLPQTYHHMAGVDSAYSDAGTLSEAKATELLEKINATYEGTPLTKFKNLNELLGAYLVTQTEQIAKDTFTNAQYRDWKTFVGKSRVDTTPRALGSEQCKIFESYLRKPEQKKEAQPKVEPVKVLTQPVELANEKVHTYGTDAAKTCFIALGKHYKASNVFNNIFKKVETLLPKDLKITVYDSLKNAPENIKTLFEESGGDGFHIMGTNQIHILKPAGKDTFTDPRTQSLIVHECVHTVISSTIQKWANNPRSVPEPQAAALHNLDLLLQDLMDKYSSNPVIQIIKSVYDVNDKAVAIDESLAYILSNPSILKALETAKVSEADAPLFMASTRLVVAKLKAVAIKVFNRILGIVKGSPLEHFFTGPEQSAREIENAPKDFLTYYGANSLVFFSGFEEGMPTSPKSPNEPKGKKGRARNAFNLDDFPSNPRIRAGHILDEKFLKNANTIKSYLFNGTKSADPFFEDTLTAYYFPQSVFEGTSKSIGSFQSSHLKEQIDLVKQKARQESLRLASYRANLKNQLQDLVADPELAADNIALYQSKIFTPDADRRDLTKLYLQIRDKISPTFLVPDLQNATTDEINYSKHIAKILKGEDTLLSPKHLGGYPETFTKDFQKQAIFFGLATADPVIAKALGNITFKSNKHESTAKEGSFKKLLEDSRNKLLNVLENRDTQINNLQNFLTNKMGINDFKFGQEVHGEVEYLNALEKLEQKFDRALPKLSLYLLNKLFKVGRGWEDFQNLDVAETESVAIRELIGEAMRKGFNKVSSVNYADFFKDLYGRVPTNTAVQEMLKEIKGFTDKIRKAKLDRIPVDLLKNFKTRLDAKDKWLLDHILGRTNLAALNLKDAKKFLLNPTELKNGVKDLELRILSKYPKLGKVYLYKCKQLANYYTGSQEAGVNLLRNANAIARLLGQQDAPLYNLEINDKQLVKDIDQLISLYSISFLTPGDISYISDLYKKDEDALDKLCTFIQNTKRLEQSRKKINNNYKYNALSNWLPKGDSLKGDYQIISADKLNAYVNEGGYKNLGEIKGPFGTKYRVYNSWVRTRDYQEGIIQTINDTGFGWQLQRNASGEVFGATIFDPEEITKIKHLPLEQTKDLIPIFDAQGEIVGYEHAIPADDRANYVDHANDIFSGLAQYRSRQERENLKAPINKNLFKLLKSEYDNASDWSKKNEFEDLYESQSKFIRESMGRLDRGILKEIQDTFGGKHFYVKKDIAFNVLGYYKQELGGMWNGNFHMLPKKAQDAIALILNKLTPRGQGKYYTQMLEYCWEGFVSWGKDTIIIRSIVVPLKNAIGNLFLLHFALKMPWADILKYLKESLLETERYNEIQDKLIKLETALMSSQDSIERKSLQKQKEDLELEMKNLTVYPLIAAGEYSTIDPNGNVVESIEFQKQRLGEWFEGFIGNKVPKSLGKTIGNVLITKNSDTFKALSKLTNYGDWLAKAIGYRFLTESSSKSPLRMTPQGAKNVVSTLFVDYDQFVGPHREFLTRFGMLWFTVFKLRMVPAALLSLLMSPSRMALGTIFEGAFGLPGTPLSDNIFIANSKGIGPSTIFRAFDLHPLSALVGSIA